MLPLGVGREAERGEAGEEDEDEEEGGLSQSWRRAGLQLENRHLRGDNE